MHKFHLGILPTSFKDLFQKTAVVRCQNTRYLPIKTISYKFQQILVEREFLIVELLFEQTPNNTSKISLIIPPANNNEHSCCYNLKVEEFIT